MGSLSGSSMDVSCLVVVAIGRSLFGIFLLKLVVQIGIRLLVKGLAPRLSVVEAEAIEPQ